jgi:hypothetical protein
MNINIYQIEEHLAKLPNRIRNASKEYIEAKEITEKEKLTLKVANSLALIGAKGSSAIEKSARAVLATQDEQLSLISAQKQESLKEAEVVYLNNKYIGVRKIASLESEQMRANISGN